jgi:hypothetical protein
MSTRNRSSPCARRPLPCVLNPRGSDRLPLQIGNRIGSAAGKRHKVIFPITRAKAARTPGRRAWVFALELTCYRMRSVFAGRSAISPTFGGASRMEATSLARWPWCRGSGKPWRQPRVRFVDYLHGWGRLYAATRSSRTSQRTRRNSGCGTRHMVRYVSRKGSQQRSEG